MDRRLTDDRVPFETFCRSFHCSLSDNDSWVLGRKPEQPVGRERYNYTDYYIAEFRVGSEGDEFPAGGPNIFPKKDGQMRSGGGGFVCCVSIPAHWHPGMKLVIKWRRDTKPYDKDRSGDQWLTATTEVPPYGPRTAGFVVHFLSGDRIRIQIRDERGILPEIDDDDPYIVQGVLDPGIEQETRRGR
ncbi:DUF3304 domain-containing protein [Burkholderia multivorans]|jgi:hypothetical protein|uniref:DUF3304 domain-containing protein n=1 Tax=Burkholderia multivorans TaxID=87883 RepID=UPI003132C8A7